jgi:hypothetical protein
MEPALKWSSAHGTNEKTLRTTINLWLLLLCSYPEFLLLNVSFSFSFSFSFK